MKNKDTVFLVLFAGTIEGRELAAFLHQNQIPSIVCVATEYGEELLEETEYVTVRTGRMNHTEMREFLLEVMPELVVDATHPYAAVVTETITSVCGELNLSNLRLLRDGTNVDEIPNVKVFPDTDSAAKWLNVQKGNILLTTGMKELSVFAGQVEDKSRLYARVLLQEAIFDEMERLGLTKKQMICMQGPFSKDMNVATIRQAEAAYLVTKESGKAGGFQEKLDAARETGATCVIIRRPQEEILGLSMEEVVDVILEKWEQHILAAEVEAIGTEAVKEPIYERTVYLLGIGMGKPEGMTREAYRICEQADCIIGAKRMLETLAMFEKPMAAMYKSEEIAAYVDAHPEYKNIVIGLSGDVGFYSGAKKLGDALSGVNVERICGISSVVYLAAKLNMAWEDMKLTSSHGRSQNIVAAVRQNEKVFTLVSDAVSVRELAALLVEYDLASVTIHVGIDLSYDTERIRSGLVRDFLHFKESGICAVVLENAGAGECVVTHGIPDDAFIRGKVPMTKEEVRSASVSKLQLTKHAIVYDVGAGTGSVSVECARAASDGMVYAVEKNPDALELIRANRRKFGVPNLEIIGGSAPEMLRELPTPTHAFIGGSSGNLKEICRVLLDKNPKIRMVLNCITLETLTEALDVAKELPLSVDDITSISTAKAKELGKYHLMMGQNPIYIITLSGR